MRRRLGRCAGLGLTLVAGATALATLVASPAVASPVFCGGARGSTAEIAIQTAFEDAQNSTQAEGYYGPCTLVGEPEVYERDDLTSGTSSSPRSTSPARSREVATSSRCPDQDDSLVSTRLAKGHARRHGMRGGEHRGP